jgi:hypothetical protein
MIYKSPGDTESALRCLERPVEQREVQARLGRLHLDGLVISRP